MACCYDCGLPYGRQGWIEAIIPDKIWNKISPVDEGVEPQVGLLCVTCIARRLKVLGMKDVPVWLCGTENLVAHAGLPSEDLDKLRNWDEN